MVEKTMDVNELKQRKTALQDDIARMVHQFQTDTGVVVKGVYVDLHPQYGAGSVCLVAVDIDL
jgi:hypothetical protein